MSKFLTTRKDRAAAAFGTLRSKGASMKKSIAVGGAAMLASSQSFALDAAQNTSITDAYSATGSTVGLIISGLLTVALLITGFAIIYSLVKK